MRLRYMRPPPPEPAMPAGLIELMEGLTREVLKHNPANVYEFCSNHMQKLLEIRDGRAPKVPLTLEQKIKRAQEKVRKKSDERRRKYDEAMRLLAANDTTLTSQEPESNSLTETGETSPKDQLLIENIVNETLVPVHQDLNEKEVEIAHQTFEVTQENPVLSSEFVKEETAGEILETAEYISSNKRYGALSEPTVEELITPSDEHTNVTDIKTEEATEYVRKARSIDSTELETKSSTAKLFENKKSSFDEYIENESLPNEEDLNTIPTAAAENDVKYDSPIEPKQHKDEIVDQNKDNQISETADETKENGKISSKEENPSQNFENRRSISENSDGPRPEQFFLDDKNSESVSAAHEDNESKISDEINVEIDTSNKKDNEFNDETDNMDIDDTEKYIETTAIISHVSVDHDEQMQDDPLAIHKTTSERSPTEPGDDNKVNDSLELPEFDKEVLINQSINFGNILDPSEKRSNDGDDPQANSNALDSLANADDEKIKHKNTSDTLSEVQQISPAEEISDTDKFTHAADNSKNSLYPNIKDFFNITEKVDNSLTEKLENFEKYEPDNDSNLLNQNLDKSKSQNPEIKLELTDSFDKKSHSPVDHDNRSTKPEVSEPECQKKIISTLSLPINTDLDERIVKSHSGDRIPTTSTSVTDGPENNINQEKNIHVASSDIPSESHESEGETKNTVIETNQGMDPLHEDHKESREIDAKTVDMHFIEEPYNDNNSPNRDLNRHDKIMEKSHDFFEKSEQNINANDSDSIVVDSSDTDSNSILKTLDESETTLMNNAEEFEQNNTNSNAMDLETAAVTIQKHFRNFMFKSKCSTFDDSINDDHNSTDEDTDKEQIEYTGDLNLNKERRTVGLIRMESVLQTVNEEKSLSLSTDDSVSSAVTVIQAQVRGFLVRKRLRSKKISTSQTNSERSTSSDEQKKEKKTVLNIHIVPGTENFLSRDESMLESMDFSLDGSPPSSTNLHPLGYDKSEPRKQLKREDAVQSLSPPSNGKLSGDAEVLNETTDSIEVPKNGDAEVLIETTDSIEVPKNESIEHQKLKSIEQKKIESTGEAIDQQKLESFEQQKLEFIDSQKIEPNDDQKIDSIEQQKMESIEQQNTKLIEQQKTYSTDQQTIESTEQLKTKLIEQQKIESTDDLSTTDPVQDIDADSCGTTPSRSTTMETVIEVHHGSKQDDTPNEEITQEDSERIRSDESDVITPLDDKSSDSESTSKLTHSGEFHDMVLPISPTQISRNTTVVREFKDVMGFFLLWN